MSNLRLDQVAEIKADLEATDYKDLGEKFKELGIADVWKGGAKKATLVQLALKTLEERGLPVEGEEESNTEEIPVGEWEVDQELLDEFPSLTIAGFNVGDVLVVEAGQPFKKRVDDVEEIEDPALLEDPITKIENDLKPETLADLPKPGADSEDEDLEVETEALVEEDRIDETKFTLKDIEENLTITKANLRQALPATRNFLLKKLDSLERALERKTAK